MPTSRGTPRLRTLVGALLLGLALAAVLAPAARAGQWMQVSCTNPNGSSSNGQGWSSTSAGSVGAGSTASANCSSTQPMFAQLAGANASGNSENLIYAPPAGSSIAGGAISATISGDGGQNGAPGDAVIYSPQEVYAAGDVLVQCSWGSQTANAPCGPVTGTYGLPANGGATAQIFVDAGCADTGGTCPAGADGYVAQASVSAADILLSNNAVPAGSGFTGTALGTVTGTGNLLFTATDPSGPGVYNVTVQLDGTTVYSATPNTNGGACEPVGTDSASGALQFDASQPCPTTAAVNAPVPTTGVANGTHTLIASVTDAAGNAATVLDQTITVDNPTSTTPTTPTTPTSTTKLRRLRDKVVFRWDFRHTRTRLESVTLAHKAKLPGAARVSVSCVPVKDCPTFTPASAGVTRVTHLFATLKGKRFRKGTVFQLMITAPHRTAERLVWTIRGRRSPSGRLYYGAKKLTVPAKQKRGGKNRTPPHRHGAKAARGSADGRGALAAAAARRAAATAADRRGALATARALRAADRGRAGPAAGADRGRTGTGGRRG
jgi:hypothetical protein